MSSCTYSVNSILEKQLISSTAKGVSMQEKCQSCTRKLSPDIGYWYSGFFVVILHYEYFSNGENLIHKLPYVRIWNNFWVLPDELGFVTTARKKGRCGCCWQFSNTKWQQDWERIPTRRIQRKSLKTASGARQSSLAAHMPTSDDYIQYAGPWFLNEVIFSKGICILSLCYLPWHVS